MTLLWYSNETPDRDGQGGQRRQYHLIESLRADGHDVEVVSVLGEQNDASIRELANVTRLVAPTFRDPKSVVGAILRVRRLGPFRGVVISHDPSWRFGSLIARLLGLPIFVDMHNVMSTWYLDQGDFRYAHRVARLERQMVTKSQVVAVCAAREKSFLPEVPGSNVVVMDHGIDITEWERPPQAQPEPVVKLFGSWFWDPNRLGLEWFADQVWPRVAEAAPQARCEVAGVGQVPANLQSVGRVPTVNEFLADAAVVATPVLHGAGAPVKYLEALAAGIPLAATPDGAHGSPVHGALVSDSAEDWARWIVAVLHDGRQERERALELRDVVLRTASWYQMAEPLRQWANQC